MTKYSSFISRTKKDGRPGPHRFSRLYNKFQCYTFIFYSYLYSFTNFYTCLDLASTAAQALPVPLPL